ncbi:MAG TPA: hypothetical protein VLZ76_02065 [Lysobacter sp.]|nr:hypothetical protein [Lysobacter sp.]
MTSSTNAAFGGFLFGVFTAYWAQTTDRNPWLWFFFGWILPPVAGLVLLWKNTKRPAPRNLDATGRDDLLAVRKDIV